MKKIIFSAIIMAFVLVSCNQKNEKVESTDSTIETTQTTETTEPIEVTAELYACPMHPEVTGKKGEKCSKCGMELTVPVTK
jgi:PBP1b-binding outer membrane lipoprotein LpoB